MRINITEDAIGTPLVGNDNRSNHRVEGQAVKTDSSDTNTKVNILLLQTDCFPFAERVDIDQGMRINESYFTYDKSILHLKMFRYILCATYHQKKNQSCQKHSYRFYILLEEKKNLHLLILHIVLSINRKHFHISRT